MSESAVKRCALEANLTVRQPITLKDPNEIAWIHAQEFDAIVVVAYGQILNAEVLQSPRLGCLNVHASLLPKWRGAAPLQRAIEAGDTETGITIMVMDEGLDTGPMLNTASVPIDDQTTTAELHEQLATIGGPLLVQSLKQFRSGSPFNRLNSLTTGSLTPIKSRQMMPVFAGIATTLKSCGKFMHSILSLGLLHLPVRPG